MCRTESHFPVFQNTNLPWPKLYHYLWLSLNLNYRDSFWMSIGHELFLFSQFIQIVSFNSLIHSWRRTIWNEIAIEGWYIFLPCFSSDSLRIYLSWSVVKIENKFHANTHTHTHTHTHAHTHTHTTHSQTYKHKHTHTNKQTNKHIHKQTQTNT